MTHQRSQDEIPSELVRLPKVDLHRHLEGSIRLSTLAELVEVLGLDLPRDPERLGKHVQIYPGEPRTASHFLSKFKTLRKFYRKPEIIQRITAEAIEDAVAEGICHLEMRFTPVALSNNGVFDLPEVFSWVTEAAQAAAGREGISLGLIASINRHEPIALAEQVASIAIDRMEAGIVGLGLAGDELVDLTSGYREIFSEARDAGLGLTIHAGEWTGPTSIDIAIEILQASRIGHGIRIMEDPGLVRSARESRIVFEVCLTSNFQSGAVPKMTAHPFPAMIEAGLQVTLNTDDPAISRINLSREYLAAMNSFGLSVETLKGLNLVAAQAAFLPRKAKVKLESRLNASYFSGTDPEKGRDDSE